MNTNIENTEKKFARISNFAVDFKLTTASGKTYEMTRLMDASLLLEESCAGVTISDLDAMQDALEVINDAVTFAVTRFQMRQEVKNGN